MLERFMTKVRKTRTCWIWIGSTHPKGYGQFSVQRKNNKAHRVAYKLFIGPIPTGLHVLHKCDNPSCVNPKHLFIGTHLMNMQDKARKGRVKRKPGELNGRAILTATQIHAIRTDKRTQQIIADEYGVSQAHISRIKLKQEWKFT